MKKAILSTLFLLFVSFTVKAQLPDDRVAWSPELLTWDDFSGEPDPSNPFHANTSSGISYSWSMRQLGDDMEFIYDVQSFFIPEKSWVRPGKDSPHLLAHEQLHFDITELHARMLRKTMEELDVKGTKNLKPTLQAIYNNLEKSRANMQKRFDAESRHSMVPEAQLKWQKYIEEELKKLEDFSS